MWTDITVHIECVSYMSDKVGAIQPEVHVEIDQIPRFYLSLLSASGYVMANTDGCLSFTSSAAPFLRTLI